MLTVNQNTLLVIVGQPPYLEKYILCNRFLDSNKYHVDEMDEILNELKNPQLVKTYDRFEELLSDARELISTLEPGEAVQQFKIGQKRKVGSALNPKRSKFLGAKNNCGTASGIRKKLSGLTCEECERLDEALVTYSNYCFYSSIIMAVSAVEFRLHYMIKNTDKKLYSEQFEKATLGQLIQVFDKKEYTDNNYDKIKQLMPDRHRPLVQLLNQYRILSAHPKEVNVTPQIAESILNLSFAFLIDPETCLYDEDYLKCET